MVFPLPADCCAFPRFEPIHRAQFTRMTADWTAERNIGTLFQPLSHINTEIFGLWWFNSSKYRPNHKFLDVLKGYELSRYLFFTKLSNA